MHCMQLHHLCSGNETVVISACYNTANDPCSLSRAGYIHTVPWAGDTLHYPGHKVMSHGHSLHRGITCAHQIYYTRGKIIQLKKQMPLICNEEHCLSKPGILGNLEFESFRQSWTMCGAVTVQKFASPVLHIAH